MAKDLSGLYGNRIGGPCKYVTSFDTSNKRDRSPKAYSARGGSASAHGRFMRYEWEEITPELYTDVLNNTPTGNGYWTAPSNIRTIVHNRALSKVKGELAPIQSFFEDWYERQQAYSMLYSAGKGILSFMRDLRNPRRLARRFRQSAAKVNKLTIPKRWLEYNFGVKPLIGTVDNAIHLLNRDFPTSWVEATSRHSGNVVNHEANTSSSRNYDYVVKIGVEVVGVNPNRALAASLGLDKPLTNAWSVLPWGWAVDYFLNVSEYLSNFEPFATGIELGRSYETSFEKTSTFRYSDPDDADQYIFKGYYDGWMIERAVPASLRYGLAFTDLRMVNDLSLANKVANLFSAISLSMKGK